MFHVTINQKKLRSILLSIGLLSSFTSASWAVDTGTQSQQMQALLPDTQTLQGFSNVKPIGEPSALNTSARPAQNQDIQATDFTNDQITLNADTAQWLQGWVKLPNQPGHFSQIVRSLYHNNGLYQLTMTINLCESPDVAEDELSQFLRGCSTRFQRGSFNSPNIIGDDSWYNPSGYNTLVLRSGRLVVEIDGSLTYNASQKGSYPSFPTAAVEAIAYQILLRASQQPELTGVSAQQANVAVNGHALPKGALLLAGQTYVPVKEFAKAMGMTSQWNTKTGALTLSGTGRKTVALTAGSTATKSGTVAGAMLQVPVLKDAGQPVMTLADLLTVTGAKVTAQTAGSVQVKG